MSVRTEKISFSFFLLLRFFEIAADDKTGLGLASDVTIHFEINPQRFVRLLRFGQAQGYPRETDTQSKKTSSTCLNCFIVSLVLILN